MPRLDARSARFVASRYARQRRLGFPWLRFTPDLEREFVEGHIQTNASRIRLVHAFGILGILGFIAMDRWFGSALQPVTAVAFLLGVTLPALAVPIAATFGRGAGPDLQKIISISVLVAGLSVAYVVFLGRKANSWFPYESIIVLTTYVYFVSGLLWLEAFLCGLLMWIAHVALTYGFTAFPAKGLLYEAYYLALANGIGWIGRYVIEFQERQSFLMQRELRYLAQHDSLTGLMNRRAFRSHAERVIAQASRERRNVGVLLFDLDHFKRINDTHGHLTGDAVLKVAALALREFTRRPLDAAGRFGGDEFIALWYDVDQEWFRHMQQDLPAAVKSAIWAEAPEVADVTVSGGAVLVWPEPGLLLHDVVRVADDHLYRVKRETRDRVMSSQIGTPPRQAMAA